MSLIALDDTLTPIGAMFCVDTKRDLTSSPSDEEEVEVGICSSDPVTIRPGDTGIVDPNPNDPNSACSVYTEGDASYLGCLLLPTGSEAPKAAFEVSRMDASIPDDKCGD